MASVSMPATTPWRYVPASKLQLLLTVLEDMYALVEVSLLKLQLIGGPNRTSWQLCRSSKRPRVVVIPA